MCCVLILKIENFDSVKPFRSRFLYHFSSRSIYGIWYTRGRQDWTSKLLAADYMHPIKTWISDEFTCLHVLDQMPDPKQCFRKSFSSVLLVINPKGKWPNNISENLLSCHISGESFKNRTDKIEKITNIMEKVAKIMEKSQQHYDSVTKILNRSP